MEAATPPDAHRLQRLGLIAASAVLSINIWTGAPLLAIWVGSRIQAAQDALTMSSLLAVVVTLGVAVFGLAWLLARVNGRYDELTGRPREARESSPWLRSLSGERKADVRRKHGISAIERVVVIVVILAVLAFEAWFFFLAGSSLPNA